EHTARASRSQRADGTGTLPYEAKRLTHAGRKRVAHHAPIRVIVAEQVADLVLKHGEQIDATLLALVAGRGELRIVPRRLVHEPAPAGGVVVEPDAVAGSSTKRRAAEVGDAEVDDAKARSVHAGRVPAVNCFGEDRLGDLGADCLWHRRGCQGSGRELGTSGLCRRLRA